MNTPDNPYASPAEVEHDLSLSKSTDVANALQRVASEFRRCVPWLMGLVIALSLLALLAGVSAVRNAIEELSLRLVIWSMAGSFLLFACFAWRLRTTLQELSRDPIESTLTEALLRTRMVYAMGSSMLLMASLVQGALVAVSVMSVISWLS
jgi:hypothetical protein